MTRADDPGAAVEVRPPVVVARATVGVAALSAVMAVAAIATGTVLVGVIALVSAGWLLSLGYVSVTAFARADAELVRVRWMRVEQGLRWADIARVEVDRTGNQGVLRSVELVSHDGGAMRWAPWYPFLFHSHGSVAASVDELSALAATRGIPTEVVRDNG